MRWLTNLYDFRFKWTATTAIGIHPTKAWLSQLVSFKNAIWHFKITIYNKLCFKLGKNATEMCGILQTAFGASCMNRASVFEWHKRFKTIHQSTIPSLSQTIWQRWESRQFLAVPIVQTLLPVTFAYSLSSEAVFMRHLRRWKKLWLTRSHERTSMGPFRSRDVFTDSADRTFPPSLRKLIVLQTGLYVFVRGHLLNSYAIILSSW